MGVVLPRAQERSARLLHLAESAVHGSARLGDVYVAVTTLFEQEGQALSPRERELAADICKRLSKDVEMAIRLALAERVADNEGAPRELALMLADDHIEVARPVLLRSRALSDQDLVQLVARGGVDHQVAIAGRPELADLVCAALAQSPHDRALIALVQNPTARIGRQTFELITDRARQAPMLHGPLADRIDLPFPAQWDPKLGIHVT